MPKALRCARRLVLLFCGNAPRARGGAPLLRTSLRSRFAPSSARLQAQAARTAVKQGVDHPLDVA